jgi:hypothetical protein
MSRVYPSIQGCPFRKIVDRKCDRAVWVETLSCGHTHPLPLGDDGFGASKRRCYTCKWEKEHKAKS